jgi:hypothetical protein
LVQAVQMVASFEPFRCAGKSRQGVVNESFIQ